MAHREKWDLRMMSVKTLTASTVVDRLGAGECVFFSCESTAATQNITLPHPSKCFGTEFMIKRVGAAPTVIVSSTTGILIDSATNFVLLTAQYQYVRLIAGLDKYHVVENTGALA